MDNKQLTDSNKRDLILGKAEAFAWEVYALVRNFPKHEQFGLISQFRRAALSVPLNIVEGYTRQSPKAEAQFLVIAYGSLKEAQFLLQFSIKLGYLSSESALQTQELSNEVGRLVWAKTRTLRLKDNSS